MEKKIFIETYGCQMNVYDSELVKTILVDQNYSLVPDESMANIVMLNTCTVRENADRKVLNRVHQIKNSRQKNEPILVGILGCMATNFKTKLLENPKLKIDFIAGPDSYKQLPQLIESAWDDGDKSFDVTLSEFETYSDINPTRKEGVNAWIAVMRGCNNFCTFCVVPYTRGRERSRDPYNVVQEVKQLVSDGFSQVTLLGQNVNSYRYNDYDFTDLMAMVSDIDGIKRIRYTSPHPKDFPEKLLKLMANRDNICKQLHMPLQSGNTRILDKMNRTYTQEEFIRLIELTRSYMPTANISTDIIVGFPTETDQEFEDTVDVVKTVEFNSAFIFKYSERPNTRAAKTFPDDISESVKTRRIVQLNEIQNEISLKKNRAQLGQCQTVLVEALETKRSKTEIQTRNDANQIVILPERNVDVGDYIDVQINDATRNILKGYYVNT
jgi:tRNA-2-methylthio-N6-dimethylallyladenosine synthase